jgi:phage terminase Nu1 subunit (DNA packaging protein)
MAKKAVRPAPVTKKPKTKSAPKTAPRVIDGDKAFAEHVGKSTRTVQTWRDKGLPHEELGPNKYRYHLDKTEPWIEANSKQDQQSEERQKLKVEREKAKLRADIARALKVEREEQEAQKNILPRDTWEAFAVETIHVARGQLMQIPKQVRRHLCSKCQKSAPVEIEKLITKALHKIAALKDGPSKE